MLYSAWKQDEIDWCAQRRKNVSICRYRLLEDVTAIACLYFDFNRWQFRVLQAQWKSDLKAELMEAEDSRLPLFLSIKNYN